MKQMKTLYRLLIIALLVCGMALSLASCEAVYSDLTDQFMEQNPQFTVPDSLKDLPGVKTEESSVQSEEKIEKFTDCVVIVTTPADPCYNGHTPVIDPAVAPTCEAAGKTEGTHCKVCKKVLVKQKTVSATGHSQSDLVVPVYGEGVRYCYCLNCGKILYELPYNSMELPSTFDNDGDGKEDVYTFSNYLPSQFKSKDAILIKGEDHFATDLGVRTAERIKDSGIWHYYLDLGPTDIPNEAKTLTWKFEVAEAGIYEICFDLGMKDTAEQRGIVMQIDGEQKRVMDYTITAELAEAIRDESQGSYMTGFSVELTAGEHVIQMTYNPYCVKTFHFRNIYLTKEKDPTEASSGIDYDEDGIFDVYKFSPVLPEIFTSENAILIKGEDHFATDLGVTTLERIYRSGFWHYFIDLSNSKIPDEKKSLTWEFEVAESGTYEMCFDLAMKDTNEQRGIVMQIDYGQKIMMDYVVTREFVESVRNDTRSSYMTGISVELSAGRHIIRMTYNPLCTKTFQFCNIYLVKAS